MSSCLTTWQTQTISPCFYDDYADGSVYTPGPAGGWWDGIWQRDFPALQALGIDIYSIMSMKTYIRVRSQHDQTLSLVADDSAGHTE